eukprot:COSAG02_NODE_5002_length_4728_cov_258.492763_1_plen_82_part_10
MQSSAEAKQHYEYGNLLFSPREQAAIRGDQYGTQHVTRQQRVPDVAVASFHQRPRNQEVQHSGAARAGGRARRPARARTPRA